MKLSSASFGDQQRIPGAPAGTTSFALICHDYDVPSKGDDVNKERRSVPASLTGTYALNPKLL